jgi:hypothetical protein
VGIGRSRYAAPVVTIGLVIAGVVILGALVLAVGMLAGVWLGVNAFPPDDAPPR